MRALAVAFLCLFLVTPRTAAAAGDYQSADAGYLIYSVGSIAIPMNFAFKFKRTRSPGGLPTSDWRGSIQCGCVGFFGPAAGDYTGRESGKVVVRRLPPGEYEIDNFEFGGMQVSWSSKKKFSIPFTITPGEATYIGNFARAPSLGTPLQKTLGAAGFFVISDKSERDLPIARVHQPQLPSVRTSVADVAALGHSAILAEEPS